MAHRRVSDLTAAWHKRLRESRADWPGRTMYGLSFVEKFGGPERGAGVPEELAGAASPKAGEDKVWLKNSPHIKEGR